MSILTHDSLGLTEDKYGNLYVEEEAQKVPNAHGYGHHTEHGATTRSRALTRARAQWGDTAVIIGKLGEVHLRVNGRAVTRIRYSVAVL